MASIVGIYMRRNASLQLAHLMSLRLAGPFRLAIGLHYCPRCTGTAALPRCYLIACAS